jgi:toxin ParE1/3/4
VKVKPVVPREQARRDVDEIVGHYIGEGALQAAFGFIDALERGYSHIGRHPGTGSPRYAHELNIPGLGCSGLARYPHWVFYVERDDHVDVLRVLHGQRDIPAWMRDPDSA